MRVFSPGSFLGGIVIGALCAGTWFFTYGAHPLFPRAREQGSDAATSSSTTAPRDMLPQGSASGAVSVTDQAAGDSVSVASVTVPPPGVWVSVREVLPDKTLGNVLGALRVSGPRLAVSVPLLRATEPGKAYAIELYRDDGTHEFNLGSDSVYVDFDTGEPVIAYFATFAKSE